MRVILSLLVLVAAALVSQASARTCVCGAPSQGGGTVNIRSCASTSCSLLGSLNPGQCLDYLATSGVWYRVTYNGNSAYVHKDYLSAPHMCGGGSTGLCAANLCSSFSSNQKRACDSYGCGNYGASRGGSKHWGWDVRCNRGDTVYAPFAGRIVRRSNPYGNGKCCDTGFQIDGSGSFAGYSVKIFYSHPDRVSMPSTVSRGQALATHRGLHCSGCYGTGMTDHIHFQMTFNGVKIDPASYIFC